MKGECQQVCPSAIACRKQQERNHKGVDCKPADGHGGRTPGEQRAG